MASVAVTGRADLTDAQWARLQPLLPRNQKTSRPPVWTKRQLINGIRWRTRVGCPWRDIPAHYGSWSAIYGLFRRWQRTGAWAVILKTLQACAEAAGAIRWQISVDSTIMRAHQHAAGARRDPDNQAEPPSGPGEREPGDHALGRSRGGWTTKLHLTCEDRCRVMSMLLTGGQAGDSPHFAAVLDRIQIPASGSRARRRPDRVLADKAYSSRGNRNWLRRRGIKATIPVPDGQAGHRWARGSAGGRPPAFDPVIYRDRNTIERGINQLKQHRAVATRFDKLAVRYLATIHIAAINQWLRHP